MRALLVIVALSACIRSNEVVCGDGRVCPPGNSCDDANHRCLSPEQIAACDGLADGSACTFAGVSGECQGGACDPLLCGDGLISGTEACDGSDLGSATCITAGFYDPDGLACTPFCTFDTSGCTGRCGDGVINGPELCDGAPPAGACVDDGFDAGPLACSPSCGASFAGCARFDWAAEPIALSSSTALAGTGPDDLWAVGIGSDALHYDGAAWTPFPTNAAGATLAGAWSIAADDVWAVGGAAVVHWDGSQWTAVAGVPAGTYTDVWAASASSVFVATTGAGVLVWDGATWQPLAGYPGGAIVAIRGTSASDVWVADGSTLWHWNGALWTTALTARVRSIAAVATDDVWVVGTTGPSFDSVIAYWNGQTWTQWTTDLAGAYLAVTASAPHDAWVATVGAMAHFDGTAWTETGALSMSDTPIALLSFDPGTIVGLGTGRVYRYRGQDYVDFDPNDGATPGAFWMDAGNDVFVADNAGHIDHYDGTAWSTGSGFTGTPFTSVFGTDPTNVWAGASAGEIYRFDAATGTWSLVTTLDDAPHLWGTGPTDMWALTTTGAVHYDGTTWQPYAAGPVSAVSGTGTNDIWALGNDAGTPIWHWDGTSWQQSAPPSTTLVGIVAIAPDDVVAVDPSYAYTWNGTSWSAQLLPITSGATAVAASAADFVVVTSLTEAAVFDGARWSPMRTPPLTLTAAGITGLVVTPNMIAMLLDLTTIPFEIRALQRTRPWLCEPKETACDNGVDDDCDGLVDELDPDCQ